MAKNKKDKPEEKAIVKSIKDKMVRKSSTKRKG